MLPLALGAASAGEVPAYMARLRPCVGDRAPIDTPCTVPVRFSAERVRHLLGERRSLWWLADDRLTLVARYDADPWGMLCCAIATPLEPIGSGALGGVTVRVPLLDEALIDVAYSSEAFVAPTEIFRGAKAPPAPPVVEPLRGTVTVLQVESAVLGESRRVEIYVPPGAGAGQRLPVILLADGDARGFAPIAEAAARDGRSAPAVIVGIEPATGAAADCPKQPCDRRMLDYLVDQSRGDLLGDSPFGRHLRWVTDELVPLIERRYPVSGRREDRVVAGYSNGGSWALAAAALRPDMFGKVLAMSSGTKGVVGLADRLGNARLFIGAGLFEPGFLERAHAVAAAADAAGAETRLRVLVSGHSRAMWDILFAEGIAWLLPPD